MDIFPDIGTPDWGFTEEDPEASVTQVQFGDGYTLRQPDGINYLRDAWSLTWSSLDEATAVATYQWLRVRKNLKAFLWTHPVSGNVIQVICTSVSLSYVDYNDYALRANFKRDFNPI